MQDTEYRDVQDILELQISAPWMIQLYQALCLLLRLPVGVCPDVDDPYKKVADPW